jgi:FkbH-like protein
MIRSSSFERSEPSRGLIDFENPEVGLRIREQSISATEFGAVVRLNTARKRAEKLGLMPAKDGELRLAIVGGSTARPLADLVEHFCSVISNLDVRLWTGDFDNYVSEIRDPESELYEFRPDTVLLVPSEQRCVATCPLSSPQSAFESEAISIVSEIVDLMDQIHRTCGAEVVVTNFRLPSGFDPGPMRSMSLKSDYSFRRFVNTQLGMSLQPYAHICDVEFLANRIGTLESSDPRTWFESKQPYSAKLMVQAAREVAQIVRSLRTPAKKVVVLDLDNTLWGGVVGDDGLEGIEIGTTSPRGEAFRAFQKYLRSLTERGILLAVCSKNDLDKATEPFTSHPEMVLKLADIACFKANWEPKSENIRAIAKELNLGLDSFVFVDDNPAEIEIVRQYAPGVTCICVGEDPSEFTAMLQDSRLFEVRSITEEDVARAEQYRMQSARQELEAGATDMDAYLASLQMEADIHPFRSVDAPRVAQLINKSNQFNLTTRRRTESEVTEVLNSPVHDGFSIRLSDRFGEQGLVVIVIGRIEDSDFVIDTWLMSCRVLKRQVEEETLNTIVKRAKFHGCKRIVGSYIPTSKNEMVRDLYPKLGFTHLEDRDGASLFTLNVAEFEPVPTKIQANDHCSVSSRVLL